ncbi:MAG: 2-amino-4-hydroxy-6-hydroxymethyldihydropteridine diphosphokinase [Salinivirgaceae bacterium]|nr:2-amino-4-hydroxy-6-hydroxymethyldihydropteridine diphosphokinase [Salinivirgaceae bacterium]
MNKYTLLLGSNIDPRQHYLMEACMELERNCGIIINKSSIYESDAWGFDSTRFLNQALVIETNFAPLDLLSQTQQIELQLGRNRAKESNQNYEARIIDIDLIFCDNQIIDLPTLTIPHPKIAERRFVLTPLAELMPDFIPPQKNKTIQNMLLSCPDKGNVEIFTT